MPGSYHPRVLDASREFGGQAFADALSPREHEVMQAISLGLTNRQAAEQLCVSVHAIKFHLASIYRKLGARNRTEAAAMFFRAASTHAPAD